MSSRSAERRSRISLSRRSHSGVPGAIVGFVLGLVSLVLPIYGVEGILLLPLWIWLGTGWYGYGVTWPIESVGDGFLALFPCERHRAPSEVACRAALSAAMKATARMADLNTRRRNDGLERPCPSHQAPQGHCSGVSQ